MRIEGLLSFLRHIERTKLLIFILDAFGRDGRSPTEDFKILQQQLKAYNPEMLERPYLVVLNKIDLEESQELIQTLKKPILCQKGSYLKFLRQKAKGFEHCGRLSEKDERSGETDLNLNKFVPVPCRARARNPVWTEWTKWTGVDISRHGHAHGHGHDFTFKQISSLTLFGEDLCRFVLWILSFLHFSKP